MVHRLTFLLLRSAKSPLMKVSPEGLRRERKGPLNPCKDQTVYPINTEAAMSGAFKMTAPGNVLEDDSLYFHRPTRLEL